MPPRIPRPHRRDPGDAAAARRPAGADAAEDSESRVQPLEPFGTGIEAARAVTEAAALASSAAAAAVASAAYLGQVAGPVVRGVRRGLRSARKSWDESTRSRVRRLHALAKKPLPQLFEVHPEARHASRRDLGLAAVPVEAVRGTAVEGPDQRGGDFLPIPILRGRNWEARWQRLQQGIVHLVSLPPCDMLLYRDEYWVLDGHNRVAAALYLGQVAIDAMVIELVAPGATPSAAASNIAQYLELDQGVRAAGAGQFTRTAAASDEMADLAESETRQLRSADE